MQHALLAPMLYISFLKMDSQKFGGASAPLISTPLSTPLGIALKFHITTVAMNFVIELELRYSKST